MINLQDFDFHLDESRIARYPTEKRDESKLMVVDRKSGRISIEPFFKNIIAHLYPSDRIFYNETRVSKRRVFLNFTIHRKKDESQFRKHEALFIESPDNKTWVCLLKNAKKLKVGDFLTSPSQSVVFQVIEKREKDCIISPNVVIGEEFFEREGNLPIPPYMKREANNLDESRYQSIFAKTAGSVAAPTASLHISEELKQNLESMGIQFSPITLDIGYGTFQPISQDDVIKKKLHSEKVSIPQSTIDSWKKASTEGSRRICLGTTTLRALESMNRFADPHSQSGWKGDTDIFITPNDTIDTIDGLITNFHLPKSSLLLLVSAFANKELILEAYHKAIENEFRFYSYGDAMIIV
ncbi:MAG: tRNA preQ1(34) S-adenosylmethionine ribosyltransferase-isomerase QueA [Leptospiraceae bacterium]|nr:tRNA preQ1(34) S-adenosylmethionine ribosyltransferase-isomerase QueA [Leptospiraceae bacterium]